MDDFPDPRFPEEEHDLFLPDSVTPDQFFARPRITHWSPEKSLCLAVLEDAVDSWSKNRTKPPGRRVNRLLKEDYAWFFSESHVPPFSFLFICELLDLDPIDLRQQLLTKKLPYSLRRPHGRPHRVCR